MYIFLEKTLAGANYKWIWSAKIPFKIKKNFLWQLFQNAIVRRDNMRKRNWLCVPSVGRMKLLYICSFSVLLLVVFGVLLEVFLELNCARTTFGRLWLGFTLFFPGYDDLYMVGIAAICWAI
jgi:hypothetical protein